MHILLAIALGAIIAGCGDNGNGGNTSFEAGFDTADSDTEDVRGRRDIFGADTGADTGFNDTSDVSADVTPDSAGNDTSVDTPDVAVETSSDVNDLDSDTNDTTTDVDPGDTTEDVIEEPRSWLTITHLGDNFQVVGEDATALTEFGPWQACASGEPFVIESIEMGWDGSFESELPVTITIDETRVDSIHINRWEDFEPLSSDGEVITMTDGDCFGISMTADPSESRRAHDEWIHARIMRVFTDTLVEVTHEDGGWDYGRTEGTYTVLQQTNELQLSSDDWDPSWPEVYTYDDTNIRVGSFLARTPGNAEGRLCNMEVRVNTVPSGYSVPITMEVFWADHLRDVYASLDFYQRTMSVHDGDSFTWTAATPFEDPCEVIAWGGDMRFNLELLYVPPGLEDIQLEVVAITPGSDPASEETTEIKLIGPYHEFEGLDALPLEWAVVSFIEPPPAPSRLVINWGHQPYGTRESEWFIWQFVDESIPADETVFESCEPWEGGVEERICPLVMLEAYAEVPDVRWSVEVEYLRMEVENTSSETVGFLLRMGDYESHRDWGSGVSFEAPPGTTELPDIGGGTILPDEGNYYVTIELTTSLPVEDPRSTLADKFRFRVVEGSATYLGTELPVTLFGPEEAGWGSRGYQDLPYDGPWFVMHSPEIWPEGGGEIGPPIEVNVDEFGEAPLTLFNQWFRGRYGAMDLCGAVVSLGVEKDSVPFENLLLVLGDTSTTWDDWDPETGTATFIFPRESCQRIWARSGFTLELRGYGPWLEEHEDEFLVQFQLLEVIAYPADRDLPPVPTYVGVRERVKVPLEEDPMNGIPVILYD